MAQDVLNTMYYIVCSNFKASKPQSIHLNGHGICKNAGQGDNAKVHHGDHQEAGKFNERMDVENENKGDL